MTTTTATLAAMLATFPMVEPGPSEYMRHADGTAMCLIALRDDLEGGKGGPLPWCRELRPKPRPDRPVVTVADVLPPHVPVALPVAYTTGSALTPRPARSRVGVGGGGIFVGGSTVIEGDTYVTTPCGRIDCYCHTMPDRPDAEVPEMPVPAPVPVPASGMLLIAAVAALGWRLRA